MSFGGSTPQLPPPPEPAPAVSDPAVLEAQQREVMAQLLRRGRASTIVGGNTGLGQATVQKKTLLGQ